MCFYCNRLSGLLNCAKTWKVCSNENICVLGLLIILNHLTSLLKFFWCGWTNRLNVIHRLCIQSVVFHLGWVFLTHLPGNIGLQSKWIFNLQPYSSLFKSKVASNVKRLSAIVVFNIKVCLYVVNHYSPV